MDSQKPPGEDKDSEPAGEKGNFWVCCHAALDSGPGTRTQTLFWPTEVWGNLGALGSRQGAQPS